jgi:arsenate reductase
VNATLGRRLAAEFTGTALLLLAVVGSGITASADGARSAQLFQHALVVGVALGALVLTFGAVSGAHFNPAVTLGQAVLGKLPGRIAGAYAGVQVAGAVAGTVVANVLFSLPPVSLATTERTGVALAASEGVATFGLLVVIAGTARSGRVGAVAAAVGAYIAAAIYCTSSASFANPAVTLARILSDTYAGIGAAAVPGFLAAQLTGALAAAAFTGWLFKPDRAAHGRAGAAAADAEAGAIP